MKFQAKSILVLAILSCPLSFSKELTGKGSQGFQKGSSVPSYALMNANNVTSWVRNDGLFNWNIKGSWNGEFPKGSRVGTVFSEGIVFGGIVHDDLYPDSVRVTGDTYFVGMQAGAIHTNAAGNVTGTDDDTARGSRVFAVRPDMPPALSGNSKLWPDLTVDVATFLQKDTSSVSSDDIRQIANQYFTDWMEWPAKKGAPWFIDSIKIVRTDSGFDPTNPHDIPGIPDAAKTIWFVCNDLNEAISQTFAGSHPIGIEEQMTLWAYVFSGELEPLNNVIFKQVKLIYKGNPGAPSNSRIDGMYISQWADCDVGDALDDFVGCDSSMSLGYAYNSKTIDSQYATAGLSVPAVGYAFLQGASYYTGNPTDSAIANFQWRKGYKYWYETPLTVFDYFAPGLFIIGPYDDYLNDEALQWYNLMRGCLPQPWYPVGIPIYTFSSYATGHGIATSYCLSGDPFTSQGWIDGIDITAGDRRVLNVHGPFTLNLHDTAEVTLALVDAIGANQLWSVQILKYNTMFAKYLFNNLANPSLPTLVATKEVPYSFVLPQNFPNPFNPTTTILYQLPATSKVSIKIYNVLGQEVRTLVNKVQNAGPQTIVWNSRNNAGQSVSSAVYFYRIEVTPIAGKGNSFSDVKKMIFLK